MPELVPYDDRLHVAQLPEASVFLELVPYRLSATRNNLHLPDTESQQSRALPLPASRLKRGRRNRLGGSRGPPAGLPDGGTAASLDRPVLAPCPRRFAVFLRNLCGFGYAIGPAEPILASTNSGLVGNFSCKITTLREPALPAMTRWSRNSSECAAAAILLDCGPYLGSASTLVHARNMA